MEFPEVIPRTIETAPPMSGKGELERGCVRSSHRPRAPDRFIFSSFLLNFSLETKETFQCRRRQSAPFLHEAPARTISGANGRPPRGHRFGAAAAPRSGGGVLRKSGKILPATA